MYTAARLASTGRAAVFLRAELPQSKPYGFASSLGEGVRPPQAPAAPAPPRGRLMGYAGNFFAAAEAVPLGKVAKPQALTEGVSYYNMYYFSPLFQPFAQF